MTHFAPLLLALGLFTAPNTSAALPASQGSPRERQVKDTDLADLSKKLAEWLEAYSTQRKVTEARTALQESLDKLQKKIKVNPLSLPTDLGAALYMSYDYKKARVVKGKVDLVDGQIGSGEDSKKYQYAISAPAEYNAAKASYPLILCIPDEKNAQDPKALLLEDWVSPEVRDNAILVATPMPADFALWTEAMVNNEPGGVAYVLTTFGAVRDSYAIDFDRVYLVGRGRGSEAAMAIAERSPDRFAGVIGRSGGPGGVLPSNFKNLPTLFSGGDAKATDFHSQALAQGLTNCTLLAEALEADLWAWISAQRRDANPLEITFVPGSPFPKRAYWIEVPPLDDPTRSARITARVERETNTIRIEARGVSEVIVYFSDALVDLGKPVNVIVNGAVSKDEIPRNFIRTLDLIVTAKSDPGRIYVETKSYHVPEPLEEDK